MTNNYTNNLNLNKKDLTKNNNCGFDSNIDTKTKSIKCHACKKLLFEQKNITVIIKCKCGKHNYIKIK